MWGGTSDKERHQEGEVITGLMSPHSARPGHIIVKTVVTIIVLPRQRIGRMPSPWKQKCCRTSSKISRLTFIFISNGFTMAVLYSRNILEKKCKFLSLRCADYIFLNAIWRHDAMYMEFFFQSVLNCGGIGDWNSVKQKCWNNNFL